MSTEETSVKDGVATPPATEVTKVEGDGSGGNDKEINLANLRKAKETAEKEAADLRAELAKLGGTERTLVPNREEEARKKAEDPTKILFQRDLKEATRVWNKTNTVTNEEWAEIQSKVNLRGDETTSEIQDKISEAYDMLPRVKTEKEKQLIEKGRKQAMSQFSDDEMDMSGGDVDTGTDTQTRSTPKEKKWLRAFGISDTEAAKIDHSKETNEWEEQPQATRKFFQP